MGRMKGMLLEPDEGEATLGAVAAEVAPPNLAARCRACGHTGIIPLALALQRFGREAGLSTIRARCVACESADVTVTVGRVG